MKVFKALLDLLNGHKMNTGTIVILSTVVLEQFLGISKGEATNTVTNIMMGIGGITAIIGYIHKWIKDKK